MLHLGELLNVPDLILISVESEGFRDWLAKSHFEFQLSKGSGSEIRNALRILSGCDHWEDVDQGLDCGSLVTGFMQLTFSLYKLSE